MIPRQEPELIQHRIFSDERGEFVKLFNLPDHLDFTIHQTNYVRNQKKGTFRGFHMQNDPFSESKIFAVLNGSIRLVCFQFPENKMNSLSVYDFQLTSRTDVSLKVPAGYATGYLVTADHTSVLYFSNQSYRPEAEIGVRWNDPLLRYARSFEPTYVSEKDQSWPYLTF